MENLSDTTDTTDTVTCKRLFLVFDLEIIHLASASPHAVNTLLLLPMNSFDESSFERENLVVIVSPSTKIGAMTGKISVRSLRVGGALSSGILLGQKNDF